MNASQCLERLAPTGRHSAPRPPVHNRLHALVQGFCEPGSTAEVRNRLVEGFFVHGPILNDSCTLRQQVVSCGSDTSCMKVEKPEKEPDPAWERVAAELERRGKGIQWLADRINTSVQAVQNWTTRGLPGRRYADVALALDESADWIVGLAPPKWRSTKTEPTERERLSPGAVAIGVAFDRMTETQQESFLLLEVAFGAGHPVNRPKALELPGISDFAELGAETPKRRRRDDR
jgi:hypothetical protein